MEIKDWTARRSGASMSVSGYGRDNAFVRITRVTAIQVTDGMIFATDDRGRTYRPATEAQPAEA